MNYKLGSLFDGSGGFPLAGSICGIEPVWASEVEPYPIAVTRSRFPRMKHLGDISKINGAEVEPVDIITFGSPCQDLSVAGKRAGLKHEANGDEETTRSGLFMEAVRIIKEMRRATNGEYPRFALWENVPGAFSSNKGEDFRIVCEELIKIIEPAASMPPVPQNGWAYADSYVGDGWSLSYRVFDAQYWGVPQRRRRIHLVVDFRGERAREVLFEREGLRGYFAQSGTAWEGTPADAERCSGADDREGQSITFEPGILRREGGHVYEGVSGTLRANAGDNQLAVAHKVFHLFENHSQDTRYKGPLDISPMLPAQLGTGGNNTPFVVEQAPFCKSARPKFKGDAPTYIPCKITNTINTFDVGESRANELVVECIHDIGRLGKNEPQNSDHGKVKKDKEPVVYNGENITSPINKANPQPGDPCHTLGTDSRNYLVSPAYCLQGSMIGRADQNGPQGDGVNKETAFTCNTIDRHAVAYVDTTHADDVVRMDDTVAPLQARDYKGGKLVQANYIVRRLTPTECARLQGFADWWGCIDPKDHLTEEEYRFWLEVRNTHAAINGREEKEYTVQQMLTWYNKLYTDSAEYKMWGNGIALPPALYCMQGIVDALNAGEYYDTPDISDAPEVIKKEIIGNAEKLEERETVKEATEEENMEQKNIEEQATAKENTPAEFCAVAQLRRLADERKALANLRPEDPRFSNDVRALEYAATVLEAVGM